MVRNPFRATRAPAILSLFVTHMLSGDIDFARVVTGGIGHFE